MNGQRVVTLSLIPFTEWRIWKPLKTFFTRSNRIILSFKSTIKPKQTMNPSRITILIATNILLCGIVFSQSENNESSKPNIIFILADDISPKAYALYGGKTLSPVMDKMANAGLYFKTAWATPRCIPTRAMLLTGKYAFRTNVFENQVYPRGGDHHIKPLGERFPNTLGSLMTANGYR